ncbi:MAG: P-II family nitrogen regulator [Oscillospiraceae bacterium]|nr:P-II family nitrogen regulator [Oscillospiraceae bacterium]
MAGFSLICCVVTIGDASKTLKFAKKYGVKGGTISIGRGTVNSRLLEFLGLNEVRKEIVTMVIESELAAGAISGISGDMEFAKPHKGIAFSYSVPEFIGSKNVVGESSPITEGGKGMYNVIYVVVSKGKAEDVIDAASKAGSKGGTIMNARGAGIHEVQKLFSVEIEPEKEVVFILTKNDSKDGIVESIRSHLKIDEPGNGVMYVLDVNEVYGLYK